MCVACMYKCHFSFSPEHRNVKSKVFARHLQRGSGDESEKGADQNTEPCVLQPMPVKRMDHMLFIPTYSVCCIIHALGEF